MIAFDSQGITADLNVWLSDLAEWNATHLPGVCPCGDNLKHMLGNGDLIARKNDLLDRIRANEAAA